MEEQTRRLEKEGRWQHKLLQWTGLLVLLLVLPLLLLLVVALHFCLLKIQFIALSDSTQCALGGGLVLVGHQTYTS